MTRARVACLVALAACGRPSPRAHDAAPVATAVTPASGRSAAPGCPAGPRDLAPGLRHERVEVPGPATAGDEDDCVDVVRIDPARYRARLVTARRDGGARPLPRWLDDAGLIAGINAGMFRDDLTPVAMLVSPDHADRDRDHAAFGGFLAFDPVDAADAPIAIAGRDCPGFDLATLRARYRSIVQGYRMIGCDGEAVPWKDAKAYSAAAVGVDHAGWLVMVHVRAAHTMTEVSRALATLGLAGAIFVEGGPEASLVARGADGEVARVGSYESGFHEADDNTEFWELPLVLGVAAR